MRRLTGSGLHPAVMTFEPHPRCVLDPDNCPASLTTLDEKAALLDSHGIADLVVLEFNRELSQQSPEAFMDRVLAAGDLRLLVIGRDFALGRGREGTAKWLAAYGESHGYRTEIVEPVSAGGREVRSSEIRKLLVLGEVAEAHALLGRHYALTGVVEHGFKVGRELGFPTVNLSVPPRKLVPARGVYAGWADAGGSGHAAAISVGYRPTFGGTHMTVEAYLLGFEGDLYQKEVEIRFAHRLRDEVKFASPSDLVEQMKQDVDSTRRLLLGGD